MDFRVGEINIVCTALDRSLRFYRDVVGCRLVEEEAGAVRLELGGRHLLLLPFAKTAAMADAYCSRAEITFDLLVENLAEAAGHFGAHGVEFEKAWEEGAASFVVRDPDGLRIEVVARA